MVDCSPFDRLLIALNTYFCFGLTGDDSGLAGLDAHGNNASAKIVAILNRLSDTTP